VDDVILVPLGIWLLLKLIPSHVYKECEKEARTMERKKMKKDNYVAAAIVIGIWILCGILLLRVIFHWVKIRER